MSSVNEIKHRISAVSQTKKITAAMEMVSSNRMRKVMSHIEYNSTYFQYIRSAMDQLLSTTEEFEHPYLPGHSGTKRTYLVISGDKGLCGSYNSNVVKFAKAELLAHPGSSLITLGNNAEEFFRREGMTPDMTMFGIVQDPTMKSARRIMREIMNLYDTRLTDEVYVIYTSFFGQTKNQPVTLRLLPLELADTPEKTDYNYSNAMEYFPDARTVFDQIVPQYILGLMFDVMVQAYAGEHFARMNAMRSSTDNANDMLKSLQIQYNMARQSAITNEIAEITGANEVLKER